jgi:hypothetical protein
VSPALKWGLVALLAAVAAGYFALLLLRANAFGRALLHRGYAERGYDERGLTIRMQVLGAAGLVLSLAALVAAAVRLVG